MHQFLEQFKNLIYFVTLHPGSIEEMYVRLFIGLIAGAGVLNLMAQLFRMSFPNFSAATFIIIISGFILFGVASLAATYLRKWGVFGGLSRQEFTVSIFVIASLFLVIPLIRSTWCGNFFNATVSWTVSVFVFLLTCVAIGEVFQMTETGREFASKQRMKSMSYESVVPDGIKFDAPRKR